MNYKNVVIQEVKGALHGLLLPVAILVAFGGFDLVTPGRLIPSMAWMAFSAFVYLFSPEKERAFEAFELSAGVFVLLALTLLALDAPEWMAAGGAR